jgi:type II secretory pathway pseudopilin PulG
MTRQHRGFTLLEALMAAGILLTVVVTVTSAISAGQQHSYEAQTRIVGTLAADELLGRITSGDYDHILGWNGHKEEVGAMTNMAGNDLPVSFAMVGRKAEVASSLLNVASLDVRVRGYSVIVRSFDGHGRILAEVTRFVPEPQS